MTTEMEQKSPPPTSHGIRISHETVEEVDYESLPANSSLVANLSAGAFAGIMEHTVMFPIDAIKTRVQMKKHSSLPRGIIASVSKIASTEGGRVLWRGVSSVVLGAGPAHAVYFAVFENSKTALVNTFTNNYNSQLITDQNYPVIAALSGICATLASDALMTPFDVVKQRMQADKTVPKLNLPQMARHLYASEGLSTFYVSYPTTLLMSIPFAAINFGVYEWTASILNPNHNYDPLMHCISGGVSGALAAAVTTPLDCIKTALQTKGLASDPGVRNSRGIKDATIALYRQSGYSAFLRGLRPRIIFNIPSTAISWTAYEMAKAYFFNAQF
ncbi:Iron transporter of the mitochondrial carrier family [Komagataella phaffii]|uniref:Mitochondrial iron transporter of the mitochondrial carrier family (MCF) n=1 Tax=Komagataella phaffii (strain GS115 / ATCC 20864) TaxID=644223 RepID=C4R8C7_KOMPG|nr:Mitochondrial iron transporter of the mitochondrial carrier family (MCF) [Komagataella phaffii GS115]AOA65067.1 GQ67_04964T0 [Komagataella phaffii]AOA70250.1 GQ68_04945T0 [Komagataella phaffii GS115]CAH2450753.1 Hypothetical protein BQ9382_C4-1970 [Komagataella phaffii CBS 7435]CAY71852.1 Mitochondrial iron transporter of the mitochondrial carrier family (MCF) [Komagataella phaffii GS115]